MAREADRAQTTRDNELLARTKKEVIDPFLRCLVDSMPEFESMSPEERSATLFQQNIDACMEHPKAFGERLLVPVFCSPTIFYGEPGKGEWCYATVNSQEPNYHIPLIPPGRIDPVLIYQELKQSFNPSHISASLANAHPCYMAALIWSVVMADVITDEVDAALFVMGGPMPRTWSYSTELVYDSRGEACGHQVRFHSIAPSNKVISDMANELRDSRSRLKDGKRKLDSSSANSRKHFTKGDTDSMVAFIEALEIQGKKPGTREMSWKAAFALVDKEFPGKYSSPTSLRISFQRAIKQRSAILEGKGASIPMSETSLNIAAGKKLGAQASGKTDRR